MKFFISVLLLASVAIVNSLDYYKDGNQHLASKNLFDIGTFIDTLFSTLKAEIKMHGGKLKIPTIILEFTKKVLLITAHARVELSEGNITGLETLQPSKSTIKSSSSYFVIDTTMVAKRVNINYVGKADVEIFFHTYKKLDVNIVINDVEAQLSIFKNNTNSKSKPQLKSLSFGELKLDITVDTHDGPLSWLAKGFVQYFAKLLSTSRDLHYRLVEVLKPLVNKALELM